ncbi:unnamed protein product [Prorocentrum cordatum]|uniref:Uncharacterized protein n=1 Tax=Prorocentrum cordatum TaxID=2364126 RepID=A0ABN9TLF2_9DINO|nr:unnamed protein product [Polarella glacialis]
MAEAAEAAQHVQEKAAQAVHDAGEKLKGASPTSTVSTAASSTADAFHRVEHKVEEVPHGAHRSCGSTFRNHYSGEFDLLAWHKDEATLLQEAAKAGVQKGVDAVSTAEETVSDNIPPWMQSRSKASKGDKDCVHSTRHCECNLGDALGRMFHKTEAAAGHAGQAVKGAQGAAAQAGQAVQGAAAHAGQAVQGAADQARQAVQGAGH